jgi:hypothetical protein
VPDGHERRGEHHDTPDLEAVEQASADQPGGDDRRAIKGIETLSAAAPSSWSC